MARAKQTRTGKWFRHDAMWRIAQRGRAARRSKQWSQRSLLRLERLEDRWLLDAGMAAELVPTVAAPVLDWSTYVGGDAADRDDVSGVAINAANNIVVTGERSFIPNPGHISYRAFASELSGTGEQEVWEKIFGYRKDAIPPSADVTVDGLNNVYITGGGIFDSPAFVAKLDATGVLQWSVDIAEPSYTFYPRAIAMDPSGNFAYVAGEKFYTQGNASSEADIFLARVGVDGTVLKSYTYGGALGDYAWDVAVDSAGCVILTGNTANADFASGGFDTTFGGGDTDAFVMKVNPADGTVVWSSYLGGANNESLGSGYGERFFGVAVDDNDDLFVTGATASADWMGVAYGWAADGFDSSYHASDQPLYDAFLAKLSADGAGLWATYLGGAGSDRGKAVAVVPDGTVLVVGNTSSDGWVAGGFDVTLGGTSDGFVARFATSGEHLWSTYLGGDGSDSAKDVAIDLAGDAVVVGETTSAGWATGGYDDTLDGTIDGFVAKIRLGPPAPPPAGITVTPSADRETSETGDTASFDVVLNTAPTATVTIDLSVNAPTEAEIVGSTALLFDPLTWNVPQTVTVRGVDDGELVDGDQSFTIALAPAVSEDPAYQGLDPADVSMTNRDNDGPPAATAIYVWDIRFETQGVFTAIVVEVRQDSNFNNSADEADAAAVGAAIDIALSDGSLLQGFTDVDGIFRSQPIKKLAAGTFADVTLLDLEDFVWDPSLDREDDSNQNGLPDDQFGP